MATDKEDKRCPGNVKNTVLHIPKSVYIDAARQTAKSRILGSGRRDSDDDTYHYPTSHFDQPEKRSSGPCLTYIVPAICALVLFGIFYYISDRFRVDVGSSEPPSCNNPIFLQLGLNTDAFNKTDDLMNLLNNANNKLNRLNEKLDDLMTAMEYVERFHQSYSQNWPEKSEEDNVDRFLISSSHDILGTILESMLDTKLNKEDSSKLKNEPVKIRQDTVRDYMDLNPNELEITKDGDDGNRTTSISKRTKRALFGEANLNLGFRKKTRNRLGKNRKLSGSVDANENVSSSGVGSEVDSSSDGNNFRSFNLDVETAKMQQSLVESKILEDSNSLMNIQQDLSSKVDEQFNLNKFVDATGEFNQQSNNADQNMNAAIKETNFNNNVAVDLGSQVNAQFDKTVDMGFNLRNEAKENFDSTVDAAASSLNQANANFNNAVDAAASSLNQANSNFNNAVNAAVDVKNSVSENLDNNMDVAIDMSKQKNLNDDNEANVDTNQQVDENRNGAVNVDQQTNENIDVTADQNKQLNFDMNVNVAVDSDQQMNVDKVIDVAAGLNMQSNFAKNSDSAGNSDQQIDVDKNSDVVVDLNTQSDLDKNSDSAGNSDQQMDVDKNRDVTVDLNMQSDLEKNSDSAGNADQQMNVDKITDVTADLNMQSNLDKNSDSTVNAGQQMDVDKNIDVADDLNIKSNLDKNSDSTSNADQQVNVDKNIDVATDLNQQSNLDKNSNTAADNNQQTNVDDVVDAASDVNQEKNGDITADTSNTKNLDQTVNTNSNVENNKDLNLAGSLNEELASDGMGVIESRADVTASDASKENVSTESNLNLGSAGGSEDTKTKDETQYNFSVDKSLDVNSLLSQKISDISQLNNNNKANDGEKMVSNKNEEASVLSMGKNFNLGQGKGQADSLLAARGEASKKDQGSIPNPLDMMIGDSPRISSDIDKSGQNLLQMKILAKKTKSNKDNVGLVTGLKNVAQGIVNALGKPSADSEVQLDISVSSNSASDSSSTNIAASKHKNATHINDDKVHHIHTASKDVGSKAEVPIATHVNDDKVHHIHTANKGGGKIKGEETVALETSMDSEAMKVEANSQNIADSLNSEANLQNITDDSSNSETNSQNITDGSLNSDANSQKESDGGLNSKGPNLMSAAEEISLFLKKLKNAGENNSKQENVETPTSVEATTEAESASVEPSTEASNNNGSLTGETLEANANAVSNDSVNNVSEESLPADVSIDIGSDMNVANIDSTDETKVNISEELVGETVTPLNIETSVEITTLSSIADVVATSLPPDNNVEDIATTTVLPSESVADDVVLSSDVTTASIDTPESPAVVDENQSVTMKVKRHYYDDSDQNDQKLVNRRDIAYDDNTRFEKYYYGNGENAPRRNPNEIPPSYPFVPGVTYTTDDEEKEQYDDDGKRYKRSIRNGKWNGLYVRILKKRSRHNPESLKPVAGETPTEELIRIVSHYNRDKGIIHPQFTKVR